MCGLFKSGRFIHVFLYVQSVWKREWIPIRIPSDPVLQCFQKRINPASAGQGLNLTLHPGATTCDFQHCVILTSVDSDEPV